MIYSWTIRPIRVPGGESIVTSWRNASKQASWEQPAQHRNCRSRRIISFRKEKERSINEDLFSSFFLDHLKLLDFPDQLYAEQRLLFSDNTVFGRCPILKQDIFFSPVINRMKNLSIYFYLRVRRTFVRLDYWKRRTSMKMQPNTSLK